MQRTIRSQSDYKSTLLRNQLTSLVLYESVRTTKAKAKPLIAFANHFFNKVKAGDLIAKRYTHQTLFDKNAVKKVFEEVLPRYQMSETTYVKSFRMMPRSGDSAEMMLVSLVRPLEAKSSQVEPVSEANIAKKPARKKTVEKKNEA